MTPIQMLEESQRLLNKDEVTDDDLEDACEKMLEAIRELKSERKGHDVAVLNRIVTIGLIAFAITVAAMMFSVAN